MFFGVLLVFALEEPEPDQLPHLPPLSDLERFPSASTAWEQSCRYRRHLEELRRLGAAWSEHRDRFERWIEQTKLCIAVWEALLDAHGGRDEEDRREHLARLERLMTVRCYHNAWFPPEIAADAYPPPPHVAPASVVNGGP